MLTTHITLTSEGANKKWTQMGPFQSNTDTSAVTNYNGGIQKIFLKYLRLHDSNIHRISFFSSRHKVYIQDIFMKQAVIYEILVIFCGVT